MPFLPPNQQRQSTEGKWPLITHTHTHTRLTALFPGLPRVSRYQKGKTNLDFTEARDSEWQWHQLGHMQVCTSVQTYNHASTPPLSFLHAGCPSCRPTNSVKALKGQTSRDSQKKTERDREKERLTEFTPVAVETVGRLGYRLSP